jgi:uncharacterized lipoprotein YehR (DUF1307 family)
MVLAQLETTHFRFTVLGATKEDAEKLMRDAWKRHRKETYAKPFSDYEDAVSYTEIEEGKAYRDGQEI